MKFRPWNRKRWLGDLDQDIRDHIEMEIQENIERGMPAEEARYSALRKFGNVTRVREETRAVWGACWIEEQAQDIRYAFRTLRRSPTFTAGVIATLALGIGLNTAVFSVMNAVLFRPLPYTDAERLVWLANYNQQWKRDNWVARTDYLMWKEQARSFDSMSAYGSQDLAVVIGDQASQERVVSIAGDLWNMMGAQPAVGRLFHPREVNTMVLSWSLFARRFGSDPGIIGRTITVNGWPYTVTGVLPAGFRFLAPLQVASGDELRDVDAYIPIPDWLMGRRPAGTLQWEADTKRFGPAPFWICVVGKLRADVPFDRARAEMQTIYKRVVTQDPGPLRTSRVLRFISLQEKLIGDARRPLLILLAAVGFVLLIACANIANLLLARASTRQREIAIRAAVGAGRTRLIRQLLTESTLLALSGCAAGVILGQWAISTLLWLAPHAIPRIAETTIDERVLVFTVAISIAAGLICGSAPAIYAWRAEVYEALKAGTGLPSARLGRAPLRAILAASQIAMAIILLAGAGLMIKSFWRMNERPSGFEPHRILVMRITLSGPQYNTWPPKQAYTEQLQGALSSLSGVQFVGVDTGTFNTTVRVDGIVTDSSSDGIFTSVRGVSPGYLRAMGVPLMKGSWPADGSLFSAVVNETFARQLAGEDAIGRHIGGSFLNETITGIVADFKAFQLDAEPLPEIYIPYQRMPLNRSMRVVVRTSGVGPLAPSVRRIASEIDRTQPVYEFQTLEETLAASISPRRFNLFLLGTFAATALLLAVVGVYSVIAYSVSLRTREIGIRLALGAHRGEILGLILRQGVTLAFAGIAIGTVAALGLTRLMASLLYDVKPNDPETFAVVVIALVAAGLLATVGPAIRAARVEPMVALRYE